MTICQTCSERGLDCCHLLTTDKGVQSGFTVFDLQRVSLLTKKQPKEYATFEVLSDASIEKLRNVPLAHLMFPHRRRIGPNLSMGVCPLLTPTGCPLGVMVRPRFCALFPCGFDPVDFGLYPFMGATPDRCLAVKEANDDPDRLFRLLDVEPERLVQLAKSYYTELMLHASLSVAELESSFQSGSFSLSLLS